MEQFKLGPVLSFYWAKEIYSSLKANGLPRVDRATPLEPARAIDRQHTRLSGLRSYRTTWRIIIFALLVLLLVASRARAEISSDDDQLFPTIIGIGESKSVLLKTQRQVHISDGGVVRARALGRRLVLTGRKIGRVTVRVPGRSSDQENEHLIYVVARRTARLATAFTERLKTMRGLSVHPSSLPKIEVTGELLRVSDFFELSQIGQNIGEPWILSAEIDSEIEPLLRQGLQNKLHHLQLSEGRISLESGRLALTLSPAEANSSPGLVPALESMGFTVTVSKSIGSIAPMVRTKVVIAEVRKSSRRVLGIRWPNLAEASLIPSADFPLGGLTAALEALESKGEAQILAMPTLLCQSGSKAEFLAGGELPIRLANLRLQSIQWKRYGIQLHIEPKADFRQHLQMKLSTEISTLEGASAAEGIPGLLTNRVETEFNLQGDQTVVLSGLLKKEQSRAADGLPGLSSLPILGALFRSEDFRRQLSELLIFLTPEIINPNDPERSSFNEQPPSTLSAPIDHWLDHGRAVGRSRPESPGLHRSAEINPAGQDSTQAGIEWQSEPRWTQPFEAKNP